MFLKTEQIRNPDYSYKKSYFYEKGKLFIKISVYFFKKLFDCLDVLYSCLADQNGVIIEEELKIMKGL